jgi:hypothetical protein
LAKAKQEMTTMKRRARPTVSRVRRSDEWGPDFDASAREAFLLSLVIYGPIPIEKVEQIAGQEGISGAVIRRAASNLGLIVFTEYCYPVLYWGLADWVLKDTGGEAYWFHYGERNWKRVNWTRKLHKAHRDNPHSMYYGVEEV